MAQNDNRNAAKWKSELKTTEFGREIEQLDESNSEVMKLNVLIKLKPNEC